MESDDSGSTKAHPVFMSTTTSKITPFLLADCDDVAANKKAK
ncbi:hypothetical protein [Vibrio sinaloensis]